MKAMTSIKTLLRSTLVLGVALAAGCSCAQRAIVRSMAVLQTEAGHLQPALQLFPAVLLAYWLICSRSLAASALGARPSRGPR
jgi:hypothetical protein